MSNLEGPHFSGRIAALAKYAQYFFHLQHNTARTGMQQHMHLTACKEQATTTSCELERLSHENVILRNNTLPPSEQHHELKVAYHRLSEAEHEWNYICQLLNITREEVDIRTHRLIHLEHTLRRGMSSLRRGRR
jgi:hypothetical protein